MNADRQVRRPELPMRDQSSVLVAIIDCWKPVVLAGVILAVAAIGASYLMTPRYESEAIVAIVDQSNRPSSLASLMARFGGLASLAGLGSAAPATEEAIARLRSREFSLAVVRSLQLDRVLFSGRWDESAGNWKEGRSPPSGMELFERFDRHARNIRSDSKTGLVRVAVKLPDPTLAAQVVNQMIGQFNENARDQAIEEAQYRIDYLRREAEGSSAMSLRQELFAVIEYEIQNLAVAKARRDFALRVIDPAIPADLDEPISPNRLLLGFLGLLLGVLGAAAFIAFRLVFRQVLARS